MADDEVEFEVGEEESGVSDAVVREGIEKRMLQVQESMGSNQFGRALEVAIADPPFGCTNATLRADNLKVVLRVLSGVKEVDIKGIVDHLSNDQCDILMKYLYKGLEQGSQPVLFKWHALLTEKAGQGCILRALVDRKTL